MNCPTHRSTEQPQVHRSTPYATCMIDIQSTIHRSSGTQVHSSRSSSPQPTDTHNPQVHRSTGSYRSSSGPEVHSYFLENQVFPHKYPFIKLQIYRQTGQVNSSNLGWKEHNHNQAQFTVHFARAEPQAVSGQRPARACFKKSSANQRFSFETCRRAARRICSVFSLFNFI